MDLPTYRDFLRRDRARILLILFLALVVRAGFVVVRPGSGGDPKYRPTAINILEGHGFSIDEGPPYNPGEASAPAYPLFLAGVYTLFGRGSMPVALSQALLDLFTCLLVSFVSFSLAPRQLKDAAALFSLLLYGLFSWPTMVWMPFVLSETLTLFFMMMTLALCAIALLRGARYWCGAGVACGLAILTRPDSVLLAGGIGFFLLGRWALRRDRIGAFNLVGFCLAITFALSPWIVRNYVSLHKFQPLASEYARARDDRFPTGYLWWLRTWLKDETHFDVAFYPAWFPETTVVDLTQLPREAYDSDAERQRLVELFASYNQSHLITPELDEEFRTLGNQRIKRAPLRFFLTLPLYRVASLWLTGFSTSHSTPYVLLLRILSVLPLHFGGLVCLLFLCRRKPLAILILLVLLTRTLFLAFHYAPETRYMAEIYPPVMAACGVTVAAIWNRLRTRQALELRPSS